MNTITKDIILVKETSEFFMEVNGVKLHMKLELPASAEEKIPLLILVHGFTGHMEEPHLVGFKNETVKAGYACLRVELYGHGKSDGLFCDHDLNIWLDEITDIIDYAETLPWVSKLILAGHSQGGLLTVLAGAKRPESLDALIPLSPGFTIPDEGRSGVCFGIFHFDPDNVPERVDIFGGLYLHANYFQVSQKIYPYESCKVYDGPVRIIHGECDDIIPIEASKKAVSFYKNCKVAEIPGDNHGFEKHLDLMLVEAGKILAELK